MRYEDMALYSNLIIEEAYNDAILDSLGLEASVFENSIAMNYINETSLHMLIEADVKKKQNIFSKIAEFFRNLFSSFLTKNKKFIENNEKWIKDNEANLRGINYKNIKIEMIPFWKYNPEQLVATLNKIRDINDPKKPGDMETLIDNSPYMKNFKSGNEDLKTALQRFFRVGPNKLAPVTIKGKELSAHVNTMISFVKDYSNLLNNFKNLNTKYNEDISKYEKLIEKSERDIGTKESFSILENTLISDSSLKYCYNYDLIFEADTESNTETKKADTDKDDKVNTKEVVVSKEDTGEDEVKSDGETAISGDDARYYKSKMQLNQLAVSIAMSSIEERYVVYMSTLKKLVAAVKK